MHKHFDSPDMVALRLALDRKRFELIGHRPPQEEIAAVRFPDAMDDAVSANQRDVASEGMNRKALMLAEVVGALQRLAAGDYGLCLDCEQPISPKRLSAVPWAARCLSCQERADRNNWSAASQISQEEFSDAA